MPVRYFAEKGQATGAHALHSMHRTTVAHHIVHGTSPPPLSSSTSTSHPLVSTDGSRGRLERGGRHRLKPCRYPQNWVSAMRGAACPGEPSLQQKGVLLHERHNVTRIESALQT